MQPAAQKAFKGTGMEGPIAQWYTRTRRKDMQDFCREARRIAGLIPRGASVLEVAPGPGFFSIELAKLGDYNLTGLDISRTFIAIAAENARAAGVNIDFKLGNASDMAFADTSFDFIYCSAAFKNFSEPVKALNEMYRVLRPGGQAAIMDLRKDVSRADIESYVNQSGRNRFDAWITRWTFRHLLVKRAYAPDTFVRMAEQSRFGGCQINLDSISLEVRFKKPEAIALQ